MNITLLKNRKVNEILSITGIMALFFYLDVKLGVVTSLSEALLRSAPGMSGYLIATVSSMWAGLLVYSYFRRRQTMSAIRARNHVKAELDSQKLICSNTGLPNRKGFECIVNDTALLLDHRYWIVLALEISNMRTIKNVHGVEAGLGVERSFAECISILSGGIEFVSLDEGSVFCVVCVSDAEDEVQFRVDQIVDGLSAFAEAGVDIDGKKHNVLIRFAAINSKTIDRKLVKPEPDGLAKRLGFALQQPLGYCKNKVVNFDEAMEAKMQRQMLIEASILDAIKTKNIIPNFQPIIDISSNKVIGFEVLARWFHPIVGNISPEEFVPVAEKQGVLGAMTIQLMQLSCEIAQHWPEHITMAVNISPTDLQNEDMVLELIDIMNEYGIDPHRLEIEITENAFVEDSAGVNNAVSVLKEQGISISIDDFGTGYSSLHQLRSIPFDKIKIDQSFIKDLATNQESQAIVKSVIALGESLGLAVIAEGIEVGANHDVLKQMGCKQGQGYLFAKPMSGVDVNRLFEEEHGLLKQGAQAA